LNVGSLLAFRALRDFELDFLTFFEGLESVHLDCGKVRKQIFAAIIRSNKAEAFRVVKPLDSTCCHKSVSQILTNHTSRKSKKPRVTGLLTKNSALFIDSSQLVIYQYVALFALKF
jgi:hypothetical protein